MRSRSRSDDVVGEREGGSGESGGDARYPTRDQDAGATGSWPPHEEQSQQRQLCGLLHKAGWPCVMCSAAQAYLLLRHRRRRIAARQLSQDGGKEAAGSEGGLGRTLTAAQLLCPALLVLLVLLALLPGPRRLVSAHAAGRWVSSPEHVISLCWPSGPACRETVHGHGPRRDAVSRHPEQSSQRLLCAPPRPCSETLAQRPQHSPSIYSYRPYTMRAREKIAHGGARPGPAESQSQTMPPSDPRRIVQRPASTLRHSDHTSPSSFSLSSVC